MILLRYAILSLTFFFITSYSLIAQCCSGGVPISGSLGLSTSEAKSWHFLLTYDYNNLNDLFEGNASLNENLRKRVTRSALLETNYGLSNRVTLTGVISYVIQEREIRTFDNRTDFTKIHGIGDGILLIKYSLTSPEKRNRHNLSLGGGTKIPLGKTNFANSNGIALPADLQPGSGAWDFLLWSYMEKHHFVIKNLTVASVITYRLTGTNKKYFGNQEYRFGNELAINLQTNYNFVLLSQIFDSHIVLRYRNQKSDHLNGGHFPNSGGEFLYVIPGLSYSLVPDLSFRIAGYIPVYRNTGGTQLTTTYKLVVSISYLINNKNKLILN